MKEKVINLIKNNDLRVPSLLFLNYKSLNLTEQELIVLIYMLNDSSLEFNPKKIVEELHISLDDIMNIFESLIEKDILKIDSKKVNNKMIEEVNFDSLYNKLSHLVIVDEEKNDDTIYSIFEEKFGRTLSPMEYTIIGGWLDVNYSEELILLALDEAIYNKVYKLNYIDKILYEWDKKGIKTKEDKIKNDTEFKAHKETKKDLVDYNWLEDE